MKNTEKARVGEDGSRSTVRRPGVNGRYARDMEFAEVISRRRMFRSFSSMPIEENQLERILKTALAGPSAGFSQGTRYVVLRSADAHAIFWSAVTTEGYLDRSTSHRSLDAAPVVLLPVYDKQRYMQRYRQDDKAGSGWQEEGAWPVPFWLTDCAFSVMMLLLEVVNQDLGALFFALDRGEGTLREAFGIAEGEGLIGAVAVGHPISIDRVGSAARRRRLAFEEAITTF